MEENADSSEQWEGCEQGLEQPFPDCVGPRDLRIFRQAAVAFGIGGVMQHIDHVGSAYGLRIVDAGVLPAEIVAQLLRAFLGDEFHVDLGAELEAAGRTCLDAGGFETLANAVGAECALVNALGLGIETRNIEGTTGYAKFAADTVFLVKVDDAIGVFHDGAIGGGKPPGSGLAAQEGHDFSFQRLGPALPALLLYAFLYISQHSLR